MIDWIVTHYQDILAIYGALVAAGTLVVKLTPSLKDDNFWFKYIVPLANWFSTVNPKPPTNG